MKCIKTWFGNDTYGRKVEVAQREDGAYFARCKTPWGRHKNMTAWRPHIPTFETHGVNEYSGERFKYEEPQMAWGFQLLRHCLEYPNCPKFRLPKD